ncbi:MAG: tRNA (adenosine(37)-N6)-threonylcarbamoyltransferase complex transferase subunit TsaD [Microgenomates group bacterium]
MKYGPILAIDTSCDETSVAVTIGRTILSNVIASQTELHRPYGGVFPTVAKQAHVENIHPAIKTALKRAQLTIKDISALAVTQGPGLAPALEVGIRVAKEIATEHNLPLIPVNHLEGHILSILALKKQKDVKLLSLIENTNIADSNNLVSPHFSTKSPILALIISGGNTQFVSITKPGSYQILGSTIDDAAGECLDKVGRLLNLGYPAGPVVEKFAKLGNPKRFDFPLPMTHTKDFNLSFSGLKTAARNKLDSELGAKTLTKTELYDFCASFQSAVFEHISYKLSKLLKSHSFSEVWVCGGVAANMTLRKKIRQTVKIATASQPETVPVKAPLKKSLCGDNAVMIGLVGQLRLELHLNIPALYNVERSPKHSLQI